MKPRSGGGGRLGKGSSAGGRRDGCWGRGQRAEVL